MLHNLIMSLTAAAATLGLIVASTVLVAMCKLLILFNKFCK